MDRPRIAHQPALDGVRAVSVLAVLLFHAEIGGFDGGYLGVSVQGPFKPDHYRY